MTLERRCGANNGDEAQKIRDTAHGNLRRVIEDYRKRLSSFAPGNDAGRYCKEIASVIQTVLPAWIQYRQTYINIFSDAPFAAGTEASSTYTRTIKARPEMKCGMS